MVHPGWVATKVGDEDALDKLEDGVETYVMWLRGIMTNTGRGRTLSLRRRSASLSPLLVIWTYRKRFQGLLEIHWPKAFCVKEEERLSLGVLDDMSAQEADYYNELE